jgi:hypothetical protein
MERKEDMDDDYKDGYWYEVRPLFEPADEKYNDMHELVMKLHEFSHFTMRGHDGMTRSFMHVPFFADAAIVPGILKNAVAERTLPKAFSAPTVSYLKMKRHYALPVFHELFSTSTTSTTSLLYQAMEKIGRPCFIATTVRYHDESYSIARYVEKQMYVKKSLAGEVLGMFLGGGGGGSQQHQQKKKSTSVARQSRADLAKEKQKLRHFHCNIAIGTESIDVARSLMKVLSIDGEGFAIASSSSSSSTGRGRQEGAVTYSMEVKSKPLLFADHFCVLSDIELANIIALPGDPRSARFNISRKGTFTTGPSV